MTRRPSTILKRPVRYVPPDEVLPMLNAAAVAADDVVRSALELPCLRHDANPGEPCRVVDVHDVFPGYCGSRLAAAMGAEALPVPSKKARGHRPEAPDAQEETGLPAGLKAAPGGPPYAVFGDPESSTIYSRLDSTIVRRLNNARKG